MENHHAKKRQPAPKSRSSNGRSTANVPAGRASAILDAVGQVAEDQMEAAGEVVSEYVEHGRSEISKLERHLEAQIASRPWQVLMGAIGIGVLAGLMLRRR